MSSRKSPILANAGLCAVVAIAGAGIAAAQQSERVAVGQQAPTFTLTSTDGSQVSLESQRDKSNVVLIFFRGTW